MLVDAYTDLVDRITSFGLTVYSNVNTLRPPGVVIDPPTIRSISPTLVELQYQISVVAAPPGDFRALKAILEQADIILESLTEASILSATSGVYAVGNQELPTYQLTATITYRRD